MLRATAALDELQQTRKQLEVLQEELMNENGLLQKHIAMHAMLQERMESVWSELKTLKQPLLDVSNEASHTHSDDGVRQQLASLQQESRRLTLLAEELQFDVLRLERPGP